MNCWELRLNTGQSAAKPKVLYYVYQAKNSINSKVYVGITSRDLEDRWKEHLSRARCGMRGSRLYMAIRKYGADKFELTILDQTDSESRVREMEIEYINRLDSYRNGYNCNLGGHGVLVMSEEIRQKISKANMGRVMSPESRRKMSTAKLGRPECAENFGTHTNQGGENPRSKWSLVETPEGRVVIGRGLRAFCREHGLQHCKLSARGNTKGFKLIGTFNDYPEREYAQASGSATHPIRGEDIVCSAG